MKPLKSYQDCLRPRLPPMSNTLSGLDRRIFILRRRISRLQSGLVEVERRAATFEKALQQEKERLCETSRKREALGQALDARPQTGVHVSPVHGHKRKTPEEEPKTSTRKLRQEASQTKTTRSRGGNTGTGSGVVDVDKIVPALEPDCTTFGERDTGSDIVDVEVVYAEERKKALSLGPYLALNASGIIVAGGYTKADARLAAIAKGVRFPDIVSKAEWFATTD